ncbi:MAG: hypothetical protein WCP60_05450 [bacterium]
MNSSDDLSPLLQSWQPEAPFSGDFNRGVWSRIEAMESHKGTGIQALLSWIQLFARPRIAVSAAMLAIFAGVFLGGIQARSSQEEHYLQSLNPYGFHSHNR